MQVREVFESILVLLTATISSLLLSVHFNNSWTCISMEQREEDFTLSGDSDDWIWSDSKYLEFTTFFGTMFCLGKLLIKQES